MEFNKQLRHAGLSGLEGGKTSTYYDCYESNSELQADTKGFSQRKCLVHPSRVIRLFDNGRDFFLPGTCRRESDKQKRGFLSRPRPLVYKLMALLSFDWELAPL